MRCRDERRKANPNTGKDYHSGSHAGNCFNRIRINRSCVLVNRETNSMKTYTSTLQIERDIDKAYAKISKAKKSAQEHLDAEALYIGSTKLDEIRFHREAADKLLRKIKRLETVRLPKLKEKLQEMNTIALPFSAEQPCSATVMMTESCEETPASLIALPGGEQCPDLMP